MMTERTNTLIVGGGQAGLAASEHLNNNKVDHIILERHRIVERWRTSRWDSLLANGPSWHDRFPSMEFFDVEPNAFAHKDSVVTYFENFAKKIKAPVRSNVDVEVYLDSHLSAEDALLTEVDHIVIATGAKWRADGFGRNNAICIENLGASEQIFTPDDIMVGRLPKGRVIVFDDDYYYMGPVIAEMLQKGGCQVTFVSTSNMVCSFGSYTSEQPSAQKALINAGVQMIFSQNIHAYDGTNIELSCMYTERASMLKADAIVMVTARLPIDELYYQLQDLIENGKAGSTQSIRRIGDCEAPALIASAVYAGRKYALELDDSSGTNYLVRRDFNFSS